MNVLLAPEKKVEEDLCYFSKIIIHPSAVFGQVQTRCGLLFEQDDNRLS